MCDPTGGLLTMSVASALIGVGTAYTGFKAQQQMAVDNAAAANLQYAREREAFSARSSEMDQQRTENALDRAIEARAAEGRIAASGAERGLSGASIATQLNVADVGAGRAFAIDALNFDNAREQLSRDIVGADITRQSQIASVPKPSSASLLLGVGSGVLQGANTYGSLGGRFPGGATRG